MSSMLKPVKQYREVLYKTCYGVWSPSEHAKEIYNLRMTQIDPTFVPIESFTFSCPAITRHDTILVAIYKELGAAFDDEYSNTSLIRIPINCDYYIQEEEDADGIEKVVVKN